ncbi:MAG: pyridoxamine 5'-phosphate oxidase family protein [Firmicutes bacterium]|nr:pyridoxamine 5'-phosphate oxidase family protein [Bacillota bacterium]
MQEVFGFLQDNAPFFVSTVDEGNPRVRPFGFVMEFEGKLWFSTNNKKNVYKQLKTNPCVEISTASSDGKWIRLKGKAVFDSDLAARAKDKAIETSPTLARMYKAADNPIFELFYLEEGEATFNSLATGESKTVRL